jgi:gamma-glutamyl phosphate reductase
MEELQDLSNEGENWSRRELIAGLDEAIQLLSQLLESMQAPLPEDVETMRVNCLRQYCHCNGGGTVFAYEKGMTEAMLERLQQSNTRLEAAFRKIEQAMLPDPYDERDISLKWLRKTIHKIIGKARTGE